jgi:hypothetical protein
MIQNSFKLLILDYFIAVVASFLTYISFFPSDMLIFGLIGTLNWGFFTFYLAGTLLCLFLYLHLLCYSSYLRFKNINQQIKQLTKVIMTTRFRNKLIGKCIKEHNSACVDISKLNKFWRYITFIIYLAYIPQFCFMLLQTIKMESPNWYLLVSRGGIGFGAFATFFTIVLFILSSEMITTEVRFFLFN